MSHRHAIIVPAAIASNCNQVAVFLGIDEGALLNTLSVPLVPIGSGKNVAATHYACCGKLSDQQRGYLENNQNAFPGAMWWRWDERGLLVASHNGQNVGERWDWNQSLIAAGLTNKLP